MQNRPRPSQRIAISLLPVLTGIAIPFAHLYLLNMSNLTLPLSESRFRSRISTC